MAVFLPMALVGGMVGELFRPFGITVTVALLASLMVALTIVPVLAYWFLRQPRNLEDAESVRREAVARERRNPLQRVYVPVIRFAVRRRWTTVGASVLVLGGTLAMTPLLETNFIDQSGQDTLSISQTMPVGTGMVATDQASRKVEQVLAAEYAAGNLASYQTTVGGGMIPGLTGTSNSATFSVNAAEVAEKSTEQIQARLERTLKQLTGVGRIGVGGAQSGFGTTGVQVVVQAPDATTLEQAGALVRKAATEVPQLKDVSSDLADRSPRVEIDVRDEVAARYGLSENAVGGVVAGAFRGSRVGEAIIDGVPQDIMISNGAPPATVAAVSALTIPTAAGPVPLTELVDMA